MSTTPSQPLAPLPRVLVTLMYLFELAILAFFVYGALRGSIDIPTKHGDLSIRGWAVWLACLFPIGFAGLVYFRFDPSAVRLSHATRILGFSLSFFGGLAALLGASLLGRG